MYKIFCDHCDAEIKLKDDVSTNLLKYIVTNIKNENCGETVGDNLCYIKYSHLCNNCIALFKEFLNINKQERRHED